MHKALRHIAISTILMLGFVAGCSNSGATKRSGGAAQTAGDEGVVTTDSDGKEWVTPDAEGARERASENEIGDTDEAGLVSPMTAPGMNELE
jgi:hypothetical protein